MTLWLVLAGMTAATLAILLWPMLRRRSEMAAATESDLAIYRDQLKEIDRDVERGLLNADEAAAARGEVERRVLGTRALKGEGQMDSRSSPAVAALVALACCGGAAGLYVWLGTPGVPDQPLAQRLEEQRQQRAQGGDIESRIAVLAERVRQDPNNLDQWYLLGRSYAFVERYADAANAYRRAVELSGDDPNILSTYAEAVVMANGNRVTQEAHLAFQQVNRDLPDEPRARYYLALHAAQQEDYQVAMDRWLALLQDSPPDAGWVPVVRRRIEDMAGFLDIDVASVLPDAPEAAPAAAAAGGGDPISRLEARLAAEPKDYEGWLALARARAGLGDTDGARAALDEVSRLYANAPFVQQQILKTAATLGLAEAPVPATAGGPRRGPSAEDMAAAREMTAEEQEEMISGMVSGLAARLEEQPDDLEGWTMLIRSYAVLGRVTDAQAAVKDALAAFDGRANEQASIRRTAGGLGIPTE